VAAAALADTLDVVAATPAAWRALVLDGPSGTPGPDVPPGMAVLPQRGDGLDQRLTAAFADAGAPAVLVGMDTPQVTPSLLASAMASLCRPGVDAVLGEAEDGGWWLIGLRHPDERVFLGLPMSTAATAEAQRRRLSRLGLRIAELGRLRDVDGMDDACHVAAGVPGSRFAAAVASVVGGRPTATGMREASA
jgi:glycosyltransferase A (GT-A) superfamily protein (DUF2064 family)